MKTKSRLLAHLSPRSPEAEIFRVLRTNLQFMDLEQPLKSVMITSSQPREGKSTIAANLAISYAQAGLRVCLVDADLRRPEQCHLFNVTANEGLTSIIRDDEPLDCCLVEPIDGVTLLPSGPLPPSPAELLASPALNRLLRQLEEQFDFVLLDTPPVGAMADALILAPRVDGVLLVVCHGSTTQPQLLSAQGALQSVKANLLGAVLSHVPQYGGKRYSYYASR